MTTNPQKKKHPQGRRPMPRDKKALVQHKGLPSTRKCLPEPLDEAADGDAIDCPRGRF